jgi:cytochrome c oxidase assembly factor CtaG
MTFMSYLLSHWTWAWPALAGCAVAAWLHLTGVRRLAAAPGPAGSAGRRAASPAREAVAFHAGLLTVLVALVTPIGYWSAIYIWVRSVQDLLLAVVAPGLIVLGAPWLPLAAGLRAVARPPASTRARLPGPAAVVVLFSLVWLGFHMPVLYDLSVTHPAARYLAVVCYLGSGVLLWLQLIGSRPFSPPAPPLRRLGFLTGAVVADTVLGMVLVFGPGLLYPAFRGPAHHALSVVSDQQVGGAVLWMGMVPPFAIAAVALLNTWLDNEDSDDLSSDLERLTRQPVIGWAGRPARGRAGAGKYPRRMA